MEKKHIVIVLILITALAFMLIPQKGYFTDGGSILYEAALYSILKSHAMAEKDGKSGYYIGTRVTILNYNVYDDIEFVPIMDAEKKFSEEYSDEPTSTENLREIYRRSTIWMNYI